MKMLCDFLFIVLIYCPTSLCRIYDLINVFEKCHFINTFLRECLKMLQKRTWKDQQEKVHFESGARLGIGLFNLVSAFFFLSLCRLIIIYI